MNIRNIITEKLPDGIYVCEKFYPVNTDFKNWLKIDAILCNGKISTNEKIPKILALCYKKLPPTAEAALKGLSEFYSGGIKCEKSGKKSPPCFDFSYDGDLIYAAFLSQYNIDLIYDELHWWQFLALFKGLSEEHKFSKIVGYRCADISSMKNSAKKAFIRKMKYLYKLPDRRNENEKEKEFAENMSSLF